MADIDRQGHLRTMCSVDELVTAYLAVLADGLVAYLGQLPGDHQGIIDLIVNHNGVGDLRAQRPGSASSSLSSKSSGQTDLMIVGDDRVLAFRSTYITRPKDSLRVYIPSLVWPSVSDMDKFHKWWKTRVERQVGLPLTPHVYLWSCCQVFLPQFVGL